jgi:hypothetical protein
MHSARDCLQFQLSFHQPYYVSETGSKADPSNVAPMLAMDAIKGIISYLRSNDICGHTIPQLLTAIATGGMRPVNYWPQIGLEQHSLPIIERRTLSILTESKWMALPIIDQKTANNC